MKVMKCVRGEVYVCVCVRDVCDEVYVCLCADNQSSMKRSRLNFLLSSPINITSCSSSIRSAASKEKVLTRPLPTLASL